MHTLCQTLCNLKMEIQDSFIQLVEESIRANWDRDALTDYKGATLQYKDVARKIEKMHILFEHAGIQKGDKIALCGRNSANWTATFLGVVTYGAVAVPILHEFKADNVHHIVNHSEARMLFVGDQVWEMFNEAAMPNLEGIIELKNFDLVVSRLGHCLFYDPQYFLSHPLEIILPVHFLPQGGWVFTGYAGLASHGGTLGLILALVLFCRKTKIHFLDILDMMGVAAPVAAGFIRLANLMNSEIIGMPSDVPWAFIFERVDMQPRHPAQLYEALAYFLFFLIMVVIFRKKKENVRKGFYFGLCITLIFTFRFFVEFLKERQVDFENALPIDMGQILSIPFIVVGLYFVFRKNHSAHV